MTTTIAYKKGETTRIPGQVLLSGAPLALTGKTVKVKLADSDTADTVVSLASGSGVDITGASDGLFSWVVTAANLTTLGEPERVWTVVNVWNGDDSLAFSAAGYVSVEL